MAITHTEVQVTWPTAANSKSVSSASNETSEVTSFNAAGVEAMLSLKADNDGTAAAGDTIDYFILYTSGDPDGAGSDEYDTVDQATWLAQLDVTTAGKDPALITVPISTAAKSFKLYAVNNSAGRAITVSATMTEVRA